MKRIAWKFVISIPLIGTMAISLLRLLRRRSLPGSREYWESKYARGGTSGAGSYGKFADFKAEVLNSFVKEHNIRSVVEFGCGDGNQLSLANYPSYLGLDVSKTAVKLCIEQFRDDKTKSFFLYNPDAFLDRTRLFQADLALSSDVIYHLIEANVFESHMRHLFNAANRFVVIYSTNTDKNNRSQDHQVRHRLFPEWIEKNLSNWRLIGTIPTDHLYHGDALNEPRSEFFIYQRADAGKKMSFLKSIFVVF